MRFDPALCDEAELDGSLFARIVEMFIQGQAALHLQGGVLILAIESSVARKERDDHQQAHIEVLVHDSLGECGVDAGRSLTEELVCWLLWRRWDTRRADEAVAQRASIHT